MKTVNYNEIEDLGFLNKGSYSFVTLVKFCGKVYCYKHLYSFTDPTTIDRIVEFTDMDFPSHFLIPRYIVKNKDKIEGYLTEYNETLEEIEDCFTKREQIKLLKSARKLTDILHKELRYIHGDLHYGNMLFDRSNFDSYIFDFDFSFKIGDSPTIIKDFKQVLKDYLKYYPYDEKVDSYLFNISTLHILNRDKDKNSMDDYDLLCMIEQERYDIPETNDDVKRLSKELLLQDTRKPYSGEYIIDYL